MVEKIHPRHFADATLVAGRDDVRILQVSQTYYPYLAEGGRPAKVLAIAKGMAQRGHEVTVLTADLGSALREENLPQQREFPWGWRAEAQGVETIYLRTRLRHRAVTWNPGVSRFCTERLRTFDVVHIYGLYDLLGPRVASYCRRQGVPYVVEPMGMFRPIARSLRLKRLYHALLGGSLLRGARYLIATAEQERQELIEGDLPKAKIIVRRNGVELPERFPSLGSFRRQWKIPAAARLVLFLGRLVSKKSPELMLEAFAGWRSGTPDPGGCFLVVAGPTEDDSYRQKLETLSADLGLNAVVLFTGPLYDDAKWAAYRDAHLFVLPSQNENFGNTAAEAVACGTPVLVTDRCGIAPLVDQRAGLVVPHDLQAMQAGLTRLLENDALHQQLQQGCAEVARALDWEQPLACMEQLYAELAQEGQP